MKIVGTDDDRALDFAKTHLRPAQLLRPQAAANDADFASGQSGAGLHRLNMRVAIDVLLAQQSVGNSHELQIPDKRAPRAAIATTDRSAAPFA